MCGLFNVDEWDSDAKYIVLDDIDIRFFNMWRCFLGCQRQFTVTDKYRKKRTVTWGKPTIWLCNESGDPRRHLPGDRDWLLGNVVFVELVKPLF